MVAPLDINELDIEAAPPGLISRYWLHLIEDGIGEPVRVPILVARGSKPGPVLGLTAAIHGNELNGIPVVQRVFAELDVAHLAGTVVGCPALNIPGLLLEQRRFNDGADLNRIAPGRPDGDEGEVYIYRIVERILKKFDYLIDLHTASFGRINSWYIRADMSNEVTAHLARLQNPDIILNNPPNDGTFRGVASQLGIHAITLELKDPHVFQFDIIEEALAGVRNVLSDLGMIQGEVFCPAQRILLCEGSYWMYTDEGGILEIFPQVGDLVQAGDLVAEIKNIFGTLTRQYFAPDPGVIIGKSIHPIAPTGGRIIHLGLKPQVLI